MIVSFLLAASLLLQEDNFLEAYVGFRQDSLSQKGYVDSSPADYLENIFSDLSSAQLSLAGQYSHGRFHLKGNVGYGIILSGTHCLYETITDMPRVLNYGRPADSGFTASGDFSLGIDLIKRRSWALRPFIGYTLQEINVPTLTQTFLQAPLAGLELPCVFGQSWYLTLRGGCYFLGHCQEKLKLYNSLLSAGHKSITFDHAQLSGVRGDLQIGYHFSPHSSCGLAGSLSHIHAAAAEAPLSLLDSWVMQLHWSYGQAYAFYRFTF